MNRKSNLLKISLIGKCFLWRGPHDWLIVEGKCNLVSILYGRTKKELNGYRKIKCMRMANRHEWDD